MFFINHKKHDASNRMPADPDIARLQATITDLITIGNSMYDPTTGSMTAEVTSRNKELTEKKTKLTNEIKKQEAIINRTNRDFTDVRDQLPETIPNKRFHLIEDYTLVMMSIAYLFMIVVALQTYVLYSPDNWVSALGKGLFYSFILTLISGAFLYYLC